MDSFNGPNFLIIGAAKSGTTSLYHYLLQHPRVFMSEPKEPNFFSFMDTVPSFRGPNGEEAPVNRSSVVKFEEYLALFTNAANAISVGEASTTYLYWPGTAERIFRFNPSMKLIVILRNPIERAFSSFLHLKRDDREPLTFEEGLAAEQDRIADNWGFLWRYVDMGYYGKQLESYLQYFDQQHIKVILFEDFKERPQFVMRDVITFLGLDDNLEFATDQRYNISGVPKNLFLQRLLNHSQRSSWFKRAMRPILPASTAKRFKESVYSLNLQRPDLNASTRLRLRELFSEDIHRLEGLTDRKLAHWLAS